MHITFYISGHGFGHASRSIELIRALVDRQPALDVTVKTSAPRWMFDDAGIRGLEYEPCETDVGMTQGDSLTIDIADTVKRAARFYLDLDERVAREAEALRRSKTAIVLGDIPPLAHAAAAVAGIRSVAVGNFTWDWIYERYDEFERDAPGIVDIIRGAYARAIAALRLPMHGGF